MRKGKDMKVKEIREKSYICKVDKDSLTKFLKDNGYMPKVFFDENTGKPIPPIEKYYDKDKNRVVVIARCQRLDPARKELDILYKSTANYSAMVSSFMSTTLKYLNDNTILYITDYGIIEALADDEKKQELTDKYFEFMSNIFGEKYIQDYNNYFEKLKEDGIEK